MLRSSILYNLLLILSAVFASTACSLDNPRPNADGMGTLVLNIGTSISTRAEETSPVDPGSVADDNDYSADDGDKMTSVRLWLVKDGVVYRFMKSDLGTGGSETATLSVGECARGEYDLYVVANYDGLDNYDVGTTISTDFTDKIFAKIAAGHSPAYSTAGVVAQAGLIGVDKSQAIFSDANGGMPLSYVGNVSIGPGENKESIELDRVCARFTVKMANNAMGKYVAIHEITLSPFNPNCGYLFPHTDASTGNNAVPTAGFEEFAFPDVEKGRYVVIKPGKSMVISDLYMFETNGTVGKTINIRGALYDGDKVTPEQITLVKGEEKTYSAPGANTTTVTSGNTYLIRSDFSSTFYLGVQSKGNLRLWSYTSDKDITNSPDIDEFLWKIVSSGTNGYTIHNEKYNFYLNLSADAVVATAYSQNLQYSAGAFSDGNGHYLTNSSNSPSIAGSVTGNAERWSLRELTVSSVDAWVFDDAKMKDINYSSTIVHVDKFGVPFDLAQLRRNEQLLMNISVTYSDISGEFGFELTGWDSKETETTFD